MDGKQQLVGAAGMGLVLFNAWTGPQHTALAGGVTGTGDPKAAHGALIQVGGELLLVTVATIAAGASDSVAYAAVALVVALWLLFLIHRYGSGQSATSPAKLSVVPTAQGA